MAIYHCSIKPVSRGRGFSATAAAAYRSGERIHDVRTGQVHDYSRKRGVEHSEIVLPRAADPIHWARDRHALWNAAEAAEVRKDARVAREYEVALPHELARVDQVRLARSFAQELANRYGVGVDFAIHRPHRSGDERNYHAHILTTTRQVGPAGLGAKSSLEWCNTERARRQLAPSRQEIGALRARWGQFVNELLRERNLVVRVDHRSLKDQGIEREPSVHLGPAVTGMQRRGIETEVCRRITWRQQQAVLEPLERAGEAGRLERASAELHQRILDVTADLAAAQRERAAGIDPARSAAQEWKQQYLDRPRPSAQELSRVAVQNWKTLREGLARARAFERLPEQEALAQHPELRSAYEGWKTFEQQLAASGPQDEQMRAQILGAARRNVIERLQEGGLFTPFDVSEKAIAQRLEREREQLKRQRARDQGPEQDGPDWEL